MSQIELNRATVITPKQARDFLTLEKGRKSTVRKLTKASLGYDSAVTEHNSRVASRLKQFATSVAQKSNLPLTEAQIRDAVANVEVHIDPWSTYPHLESGNSRQGPTSFSPRPGHPEDLETARAIETQNLELPGRTLKLPKKVGPSKTAKTGYVLGIGIAGAMGAASDVVAGSVLLQNFTYPFLPEIAISVSVLVTSTYGAIRLIKNMVGAWKNKLAYDSQNLANALETAIRDVLAKAVPAKQE